MRRGTFATLIAVGAAVPLLVIGIAASRADVRAAVKAFISPLPPPRPAGGGAPTSTVNSLPPQVAITGAESSELRALAGGDAGAPTPRGARTVLAPETLPPAPVGYELPHGLRRTELAARSDASIDRVMTYLATDGKGHGALLAAAKRSGQHRDEIERVLAAWKVPAELTSVIYVESGFNTNQSAMDGGVGMWSLPSEVAKAYGLAVLQSYDERRAVALSTEAMGHYLADLHERFGAWELAILAVGMGYATTLEELQKHSSTDYWDIASELPAEATAYVAQVLAVATILDNRDRFGLDLAKPDDPVVTSDLEVPAGATFATVARAAGTSVETLRALNPEYLGNTVPDTGFAMAMHLPSAGLARARELLMPLMYSTSNDGVGQRDPRFDYGRGGIKDAGAEGGKERDARAPDTTVPVPHAGDKRMFYRVQDGDTLDSLARRYGISREAIARDNALDPSAGLRPGQLILLRPEAPLTP
jgi:hypothetical protein